MQRFFKTITRFFRLKSKSRPEDIPRKLDPEILRHALDEARFLRGHAVDVQSLRAGEIPTVPRRAD